MLRSVVILLLVALGALLIAQLWDAAAPGAAVNDARACGVTNNCTLGRRLGDGTCVQLALSRTTACQSACYASKSNTTYCAPLISGGGGECVGDASECLGTCVGDTDDGYDYCQHVLPLDTDFWGEPALLYTAQEQLLSWKWTCELNQCLAIAYGAFAIVQSGDDGPTLVGVPGTDCSDYLNQTWYRQAGMADCIISERLLLAPSIQNASTVFHNHDEAVQPFLCTYRYACSSVNQTEIVDYVYDSTPLNK